MTPEQLATLKAAILAETDPAFVAYRDAGNNGGMMVWFNEPASPAFTVWRSSVSLAEVGVAVNYVAVEAMTDANRGRINTFYLMNPDGFSPERTDVRSYWSNTFSGALGGQGQATRDALEALWRRLSNRVEKVFATGTGTDVSPATLGYEGAVTLDDIRAAVAL